MTSVSPQGSLQIVNGTPYTFTNTNPDNPGYQMTSWNPAASIAPGTSDSSYVEYKEGWFLKPQDTQATVTYNIGDTGYSFSIRATDDPANLQVRIDGFSTSTMKAHSRLVCGKSKERLEAYSQFHA
ncbi:hypothetical protein NW768_009674 [Fusarium equiseti]|uniref:Uncharacterized protein n=1 Tax=Fusarium equiseti TaxID=61235 RepID=A0ABQ8R1Z8_FUSEQ|nr:hypothetical protein NW768_009674 [Fusarium equiseti]